MLCPKCNEEMDVGTAVFMGATGFAPTTCNFVSNEEKKKSVFKAKTVTKAVSQCEAYQCKSCNIIVPIIK